MELKTTFKVTVKIRQLDVLEKEDYESYNDKTIDLYLNSTDAMMILFKFTPSVFKLSNGMVLMMKFSGPENKLVAMILTDLDEEKYIIMNPQKLWSEVLEAFEGIRILDKLQLLSSIDIIDKDDEE